MSYSKDIGNWAEDQATQHIQQAGWTIVKRNFHCHGGELDIVAVLADTCLLYTSPSPRDATLSRMPSSA